MIALLRFVLGWPFLIGGELADAALVRLGVKYRPATGPARRRRR